ncbi:PREDICTED: choline O-acetyltransferase isoform X2 [Acromyrmex echinatior]|uniref:choline O-acetyltransferase isoform X2 n=1 Tax=Acromyrmex echinatior TaxID=103372 RepID=UPI000580DAD4|nr:PREDICTED: choline O-acetyltransferase isoform X2 [Acromyrmex echinatior]
MRCRRVPCSRWWRVWGLTHGLTTANPWILAVAAAPCRAFRGETATVATATAAVVTTVREGAAAIRWRGGLRGQTFQSHPDGETRRDAPAIGSPSVLYANFKRLENVVAVADSVVNSIEKVEGPGTRGVKESVNDSKDEDGSDVASTLSGLLAGLPTLAGPQRLANSLKQKFASNSEGWRDSVLGAPRRLLVTLGSLSRDSSPCPAAKEEALPSLPVPDLETTLQKYLAQVEAITPNHLEKTRSLVRAFLSGPGPKLQQRLFERRQKVANWATEWWLNDMYLSIPLALPINSNPGLAAKPKRFANQQEAAVFLARFLTELLNYQELLDRSGLEIERVKSKDGKTMQPLCMAQHYQIFRIYRRPGVNNDEQIVLDRASSGDHIIVAHHNQFYSVPVRASDRGRITEIELVQQLLRIMETKADPRTPPVGILTTTKRPAWAKAREELIKNERNRHNLELLERCLCVVCIDDDVLPTTFNNPMKKEDRWIGDRDYANVLHHALHGGGSRHLGANRWFDKTFHAILGKDGMWGLTYEHSAGEAPAVFNAFEDITEKVDSMSPPDENLVPSHLPAPEKLEWCLTEQSLNDIREAMMNFDALVEDLDLCILWFEDYSKEFIKSCRVSPDSYIQLALQLTYFRLHGKLVATYESAGIRRFALGRVDCIRAASPEALGWAKAMCQGDPHGQMNQPNNAMDGSPKRAERIKELFDLAVQRQTKEMNDNIHGQGIDNHLMGLRYVAKEAGEPIPEIFTDEAYAIVNHFALSTSQVTTKNDVIVGYGPVVPDGYGCAYNVRKNGFIFSVSAFHSDGRTSAMQFAQTLEQSLRDMAAMIKNSKK